MKTFRVPIKSDMQDFTNVHDLWVTFNNQEKDFDVFKIERSSELLLCLNGKHSGISEFSDEISLNEIYKKATADKQIKADVIHFDSENGRLSISVNSPHLWVLFSRNTKEYYIIKDSITNEKIELGDFLLCFEEYLTEDQFKTLADDIWNLPFISYSMIDGITELMEKNNLETIPLIELDYSPKEHYKFEIKSTLNAVSLTIDMIKNKVLKYHYDKIWKIETVLHEALVNAITYGNELDYEKPVYIMYEVGSKGLRVWVRDLGDGFDVTSFTVPVGTEALEQISGRGIYIMKKFSEALFFNEVGNHAMIFFEF